MADSTVEKGKILLVEDDGSTRSALQRLLEQQKDLQIKVAGDGADGLSQALTFRPDVILSDYSMPGMNGFELCRRIRTNSATAASRFVILSAYDETELKVEGLRIGVDDYLTKPVDAAELMARVGAMLRIKRLHDALEHDKKKLANARRRSQDSFDQLLTVLLYMLDLNVPGAVQRGERLAQWAVKVAARFGIPDKFLDDLRLAALLHEIGLVAERSRHQDHTGSDWHRAVTSRAILQQVEMLQDAADLVGSIYENWDGTGRPDRLLKGQIPLRSRILRTLIDFLTLVQDGDAALESTREAAMDTLSRGCRTRYDPAVVKHCMVVVIGAQSIDFVEDEYHVAIEGLKAGMELAEDLYTTSGIKLLSESATITPEQLKLLRTRHQNDPILEGAWVRR